MPNGKNNPQHPFVRKPGSDEDLEERQAARDIVVQQRGGLYSDRIKKAPYSQLDKKMQPKQPMERT